MNPIVSFPSFTSSKITTVSYNYEPISEFIKLLDKLYQSSNGETQKEICRKYKDILNKYLGGKAPLDDQVNMVFQMCRLAGSKDMEFMGLAKRLYQLITQHIDLPLLRKNIFTELQKNIEGHAAILCRNNLDWEEVKPDSNCPLMERVTPVLPKQLRFKYLNIPLIIFSPTYWYREILSFPSSEITYIIQPLGLPTHYISKDIFDGFGEVSLWTSEKINPTSNKIEFSIPSPHDYKRKSVNEVPSSLLLSELNKSKPTVFTREIKDTYGNIENIDLTRKYLCFLKDGSSGFQSFDEDHELNQVSYIVKDIDYSELSDDDVNRQLREHMETWKYPLRSYHKPYELPRILELFGATKAKINNIRNWMKTETIRPYSDKDFIALLRFAKIPEVDFPIFFSLAKNIRSNCISIGHRKSEIARDLVAKELRRKLTEDSKLPSRLNVGKIKVSILTLG